MKKNLSPLLAVLGLFIFLLVGNQLYPNFALTPILAFVSVFLCFKLCFQSHYLKLIGALSSTILYSLSVVYVSGFFKFTIIKPEFFSQFLYFGIPFAIASYVVLSRKSNTITLSLRSRALNFYYILGLMPFITIVLINLQTKFPNKIAWMFNGWDHVAQHLSQIIGLLNTGYLTNSVSNSYPRAIHSTISLASIFNDSIFSNVQYKLNSALIFLSIFDIIGILCTQIILLKILLMCTTRTSKSNSFQNTAGFLLGLILSSDQFLSFTIYFGWSTTIWGALTIIAYAYVLFQNQLSVENRIVRTLLVILGVHVWFLLIVPMLLIEATLHLRESGNISLKFVKDKFFYLQLILFVFYSGPILWQNYQSTENRAALSSNNFVPEFDLRLKLLIIVGSLMPLFSRSKLKTLPLSFGYLVIVSAYLLALFTGSGLVSGIYYYPAKYIWTALYLLLPFALFYWLDLFSSRIMNVGAKSGFIICCMGFVAIQYSNAYSYALELAKGSGNTLNANQIEVLMDNRLLIQEGRTIYWNGDLNDPLNSFWLLLAGRQTINPMQIQNMNYVNLCEYLRSYPDTILLSSNFSELQKIDMLCKTRIRMRLI